MFLIKKLNQITDAQKPPFEKREALFYIRYPFYPACLIRPFRAAPYEPIRSIRIGGASSIFFSIQA